MADGGLSFCTIEGNSMLLYKTCFHVTTVLYIQREFALYGSAIDHPAGRADPLPSTTTVDRSDQGAHRGLDLRDRLSLTKRRC